MCKSGARLFRYILNPDRGHHVGVPYLIQFVTTKLRSFAFSCGGWTLMNPFHLPILVGWW